MLMSANPENWATSAPHSPTRPFEMVRPSTFARSTLTPWLLAIASLSPVARRATPMSVPRNQTVTRPTASTTAANTPTPTHVLSWPASRSGDSSVVSPSRGTLALPMIRRLIE